MNALALMLATWFGCGYFPWGPGTVGSVAALIIAAVLHSYAAIDRVALAAILVLLLWPGVWSASRTARVLGREDPGLVVIDEVLGQWLTLLGASVWSWRIYLAAFILFRTFDIWKPWPVRQLERLPAGQGIVADDLAAGLYAALILYIGGKVGLH